ncbi:MAG: VCBS repeat-containing protein [Acidobacteriales bacterium]|nr:VCBS repeat-containing protein [Terriglobales bacterium]
MKTRIRAAILLVFSVALFTAAGAQQFISAPQYPVGGEPWRVVTADFNRDGNADLAVGSNSPLGQISILLGNGDGTFRRGQQFQKLNQSSWGLVVGDWNGDGVLDLASADQSYGAVRIYLGIGDGSFTRGDEYAMSKEDPSGISTGDLNGDGVLDLVTANYFGSLSVLLGKGDGTFAVAVDYPLTGFQGNDVVVGDLNKDGNLDVVGAFNTKSSFKGFLQVYLGNGDGTLRAPTAYSNGDGSNGVAMGDLNGDGIVDLCASSSGLVVLFGNGDGSFAPAQYYPGLLLSFTSVAAADLNDDGRLDVVQSTAAVWQNRGDGTFLAPVYYGISVAPAGLAVGDFNRDGHADVAIADAFTQTVSVLLNTSAGKLMDQRVYNVGFTGDTYPQGLAAGYIDRDKVLDLAVTDEYGARVLVLPGNPDGSFRAAKSFGTGLYPNQVALADVDGDGWTDIVTANGANSISVLRGNGIGDFATHVEYASGLVPLRLGDR